MNTTRTIRSLIASVLVVGLALLAGCNVGSSSSSGATTAQIQQLRLIGYGSTSPSDHTRASLKAAGVVTEGINDQGPQTNATATTGAGVSVGVVINYNPHASPIATMQSASGYFFDVNVNDGDVQPLADLYFVTSDCSGAPLLTVGDNQGNSVPTVALQNGWGFTLADGTAWVISPGATAEAATASSESVNGGCNPITLAGNFFYVPTANTTQLVGANVGGAMSFNSP